MTRSPTEIEELERRVREIPSWYHAIDLGDGVRTPGPFDMAAFVDRYRLPDDMSGMRVLDVGASNGYFSSEFERRGADEVVAIDLGTWGAHDWTPRYRRDYEQKSAEERRQIDEFTMRRGFELVCGALGCTRIRKEEMPIYEIAPDRLGEFDLVFCGSMLMHVRDPILGVQRMRSVCKSTGRLVVSISTSMPDTDEPIARFVGEWDQCNWWQMSPRCLTEVLRCCDFEVIEPTTTFTLSSVDGGFVDPTFVCHARPQQR